MQVKEPTIVYRFIVGYGGQSVGPRGGRQNVLLEHGSMVHTPSNGAALQFYYIKKVILSMYVCTSEKS